MISKALISGYIILAAMCAGIIVASLAIGEQSPLSEKAFDVAAEVFKLVIAAAIGSFSALAGAKKSDGSG